MADVFVVKGFLGKDLCPEPNQEAFAILPLDCIVTRLRVADAPEWWEVSTAKRSGETVTGFTTHTNLEPMALPPAEFPRVQILPGTVSQPASPSGNLVLGVNERFRQPILQAASRCGLEPAALACLIDAEAAKTSAGMWKPDSANPDSTAVGLTQFIAGTWLDMAQQEGTLLHAVAKEKGFIDAANRVVMGKQEDVLRLRLEAELSIVTAGDYARQNLDFLAEQGFVPPSSTDDDKARLAYLAHHEGRSGAVRFLKASIEEANAENLLRRNAGPAKAVALKQQHGTWSAAYMAFLNDYMDQKIQPDKFRA